MVYQEKNRWHGLTERLHQDVRERDRTVASLHQVMASQDEVIVRLRSEVAERDQLIGRLRCSLASDDLGMSPRGDVTIDRTKEGT